MSVKRVKVVERSQRDSIPLSLLSSESSVFVKENPDRKTRATVNCYQLILTAEKRQAISQRAPSQTRGRRRYTCECYLRMHYLLYLKNNTNNENHQSATPKLLCQVLFSFYICFCYKFAKSIQRTLRASCK